MRLTGRSELGTWQLTNWSAHLLIFEKSEKCPFWVGNSIRSRISQKWDLMKCLDSRLVWDRKKRFILKNSIFDIFGRFPMTDCLWRLTEDFGVWTLFSPYGSAMNLCLKSAENCQFFIFRKNKPKLASYFKMSKKTHFWPNLSSFDDRALKTTLIPIYQLNVLERTDLRVWAEQQKKPALGGHCEGNLISEIMVFENLKFIVLA